MQGFASGAGRTPPRKIIALINGFIKSLQPHEASIDVPIVLLRDNRTGAWFTECHLQAGPLVALSTTDVPLDPEEQEDYRANREIVSTSPEYRKMIDDALGRRAFSNLVAEYTKDLDTDKPLKIIGGQHRWSAIEKGLADGVEEVHGVKVYFGLNKDQRLDVQLISNTNIDVSADLLDRMYETRLGPELRDWCQSTGLLVSGQDFADRYQRGGPFTVRYARTFITNFYIGMSIDPEGFEKVETTPVICGTGFKQDDDYERVKQANPDLWKSAQLSTAAREFVRLMEAQRAAFTGGKGGRNKTDFAEKAMNRAVLSAWAFVAGVLQANKTRLRRHYSLADAKGGDPLNAEGLAKARHKTDPATYRGLGYRTDPRECGRMAELFYAMAEHGGRPSKKDIDVALARYHTKAALLEQQKVESRAR
ncbi:MAG TPA: hypothetical protein DGT21_11255 [Armatimonadetes bacterium]|jgi:hypothetical protein|nr:hypothetical protein [Armatimonadota bacterium]